MDLARRRADPPAALEVLAEELAQRDELGLPVTEDELVARFPDWATQVRALLRASRALAAWLTLARARGHVSRHDLRAGTASASGMTTTRRRRSLTWRTTTSCSA